jgi:hypothetical protein
MIQAMLWKEYREQRAVWLTLAVVSGAGLFGLMRLMAPDGVLGIHSGVRESLEAVAVLLAWTYGMVCGSILLAGEREGATLTFLDVLPIHRLQLWLIKWMIGLGLLFGQVAVLVGVVIGLGITETAWQTVSVALLMLFFGMLGMAWGLLFSSRGESVLNVIGLAIAGQIAGYIVMAILFVPLAIVLAIFGLRDGEDVRFAFVCLAGIALTVGPFLGSARIFSQPDRLRRREERSTRRPAEVGLGASWGRLLWLNYTQMRRLTLGLTLFALGMGLLMLAAGPVGWPILTLLIGVLCGVTVCADEQACGSFRFLGDQRFPLGRLWIAKVGMRFALAVFAAVLLILPSLIYAIGRHIEMRDGRRLLLGEVFHSSLVGPVVPLGVHLTIWLLYGFSVGQLGGLLFRKSLVAGVVSLGGTILLVSLWLPSLLGMGLHFWQVAGVPVILLLTAWSLVPAWVADRLLARGTFVRLGAALAAVVLWTAGGLWYRVVEIPDVPDQLDMPAFVAGLPTPEKNKAGEIIRSACTRVSLLQRSLSERRRNQPQPQPDTIWSQPDEVLKHGWSDKNREAVEWLDALLQDNWMADLAEVPDLPPGVFENPRLLTLASNLDKVQAARTLASVLAIHGLRRQAAGDDAVFVENFRIGLAVARSLQHDSPVIASLVGRAIEGNILLSGLDRWLEKLRGHPELLKRVLQALVRYEADLPDEREPHRADFLAALNTLEQAPEELLQFGIERLPNQDPKLRRTEFQVAALAWLFPWEEERHHRILRVVFQGDEQERQQVREWGFVLSHLGFRQDRLARPKRGLARLRAVQLTVALRLYQAETGKPAESLDLLVPRYLPSIPTDPFDGQPFRYRLSRGERIGWPPPEPVAGQPAEAAAPAPALPPGMMPPGGMAGMPEPPPPPPTRLVARGQGILWSVGEDGRDDGGVQQCTQPLRSIFGEDIIYLVPPPRK